MADYVMSNFEALANLSIGPPTSTALDDSCADSQNYTDPRVCAKCRKMRIVDVPSESLLDRGAGLKNDSKGITLLVDDDYYNVSRWRGKTCLLCAALDYEPYFGKRWLPAALREPKIAKSFKDVMIDYSQRPVVYVSVYTDSNLFKPQPVPEWYSHDRGKLWVDNCTKHHARCNGEALEVQGMRLIDCQSREIVDATPSMAWVALSYVWGLEEPRERSPTQCDKKFDRLPSESEIPATVSDAIVVTLGLDYQYLWVDEYCIDQKEGAHKATQIRQMDRIYRGAELTIVATGSTEYQGLPGVSAVRKERSYEEFQFKGRRVNFAFRRSNPYRDMRNSPWMGRAWTFQEGYFSKRLLVFTEKETSFYCDTACWREGLGGLEHIKSPAEIAWDNWTARIPLWNWDLETSPRRSVLHRYREFLSLASQYTWRSLTLDQDALNAFSGIMHSLLESEPRVLHFAGLPYIPQIDETFSKEIYVCVALSWHRLGEKSRRRTGFPSWTWAGWSGSADWSLK